MSFFPLFTEMDFFFYHKYLSLLLLPYMLLYSMTERFHLSIFCSKNFALQNRNLDLWDTSSSACLIMQWTGSTLAGITDDAIIAISTQAAVIMTAVSIIATAIHEILIVTIVMTTKIICVLIIRLLITSASSRMRQGTVATFMLVVTTIVPVIIVIRWPQRLTACASRVAPQRYPQWSSQ